MRRAPRFVLGALASLVAVACASAALALPGDPGFAPSSPADGAVVAPSANGFEMRFSCPVYRSSDAGSGFSVPGGPRNYGITLATSTRKGPGGHLADVVALGRGEEIAGTSGPCASLVAAGGSSRPQETPGTYDWQVWRLCVGCAGDYEVGPVRKLVVRSAVVPRLRLRLQGTAYAGFGVFVSLTAAGVPDRTSVDVQLRKGGGGWATVARTSVLRGAGEAAVVLSGGAQQLRAVVRTGADAVASAPLPVMAAVESTRPEPLREGPWRGAEGPGTATAGFRVAGRAIRGFQAKVPMLCPGVEAGRLTTQVGTAIVDRIAVAPDGSFVGAASKGGSTMRVRGRLAGGRVVGGRVELGVGACVGNIRFQAKPA